MSTRRKARPSTRGAAAPPRRGRRALWAGAAAAALAAAAVVAWLGREPAFPGFARGADQNVLLITIDTLRADALGSYGGRAATPALDALARDGVRFTFAHAHAVVTLPSHASILTGRYPFEHGVRDNAGFRLGDEAVTLAESLKQHGWSTAAFVGSYPVNREFGLAQGYEVYDDVGGREAPQADFVFVERRAGEVVGAARTWIDAQPRPWFAWVHVFDPHAPYAPPAPFDARYPHDPYAGEVAYTDQALGTLLEAVRAARRPTTVIVTADHGEGLGDHGEPTHGVFAYESTLRVPLLLTQVGGGSATRRAGAVSDVPVRHVDIVPTLLDLLGVQGAGDLPGRTLLEARDGEPDERASYFEAMTAMLKRGWAPLTGAIVGRDKYIDLPLEELYDLAADPHEATNLAPTAADRRRAAAARLAAFAAMLPGEQLPETAEARARLQSLGYLSGSAPRKARYTVADDPKQLIDVDRLMIQGIELHRAGRTAEAADAYRQVIVRRPDMGLAYRRLAYILWEGGQSEGAIDTLRGAPASQGRDLEIEVRLATYLAETGGEREAIAMLERVASAAPDHRDARNALGIAYARAGRVHDALALFGDLARRNPRDGYALENLGTVHLQAGDYAAAAEAFTRAAANDPGSSRAQAGLGVVALHTGRRDAAIAYWRRAVQLDATNYDALFNLATELVNDGRLAEAQPHIARFVRSAPRTRYGPDIEKLRPLLR